MNIRYKPILAAALTGVISVALLQSSTASTLNLTNTDTNATEVWTITSNITVDGQGDVSLTATPPAPPGGGGCTTAGTLGFSSSAYSVAEGSNTNITVNRTVCGQGAVTVNYGTSNGTGVAGAVAGTDYTTASGVLTWNDGETGAKTFQVITQGESPAVTESNKTVSLALSSVTGGATLGTAAATLTINDVAAAGGDPNCPAIPAGLSVRDANQSVGTAVIYKNTPNNAVAVKFTPGSSGSVDWSALQVSGVYPTNQLVSISSCRGDFTKTYPCGAVSTQSKLNTSTASGASSSVCKLDPGKPYYVNVRNATTAAGADSCPAGKTCGALLQIK
jgi:hypothetical protein